MDPILGMIGQTGVNYATGLLNDKRQQDQQRALNNIQKDYTKEMTEYNMRKQLEMWEKTGYVPTVDQMKRAGLNPALLYKGSGAGGSTQIETGAPNAGGAPNAPLGITSVAETAQLALLNAQKENIEADTKNKIANTTKTSGIDTELGKVQLELQNLDLKLNEDTYWERVNEIVSKSIEQQEKGLIAGQQRTIGEETLKDQITKIKQEAITAGLQKTLTEKQINLTEEQIRKIAADIVQRGQEITIQEGYLSVSKMLADFNTNWGNIIGKEAIEAVGGMIKSLPLARILGAGKTKQNTKK